MRYLRTIFLLAGFLSFISGMLSLVLVLVGANLTFLAWIDVPGSPRGIILRVLLIGGGLMMSYLALNPVSDDPDEPLSGE